MATIPIWLEAARPKTLIAGLSPILIGTMLCLYAGFFDLQIFLSTIATGLSIQIGTNFANDYFDFRSGSDDQGRIGPRKLIVEKLLSLNEMGIATILAFLFALIFSMPLIESGGGIIAILTLAAIGCGVWYSAGRFSLSHLGLGDIFVVVCFGSLACGMTFYLQTGVYMLDGFLAGLAPGCISCAILSIDNLRDRERDAKSNKLTLPVRFGEMFGKIEYITMLFIPLLIPPLLHFICNYTHKVMIADLIAIPAAYLGWKVYQVNDSSDYAPFLPKTAALLVIYTLLLYLGTVL